MLGLASGTSSTNGEHGVEVLMGKCIWDGRVVKPDNRLGVLSISKATDGLPHIQWRLRGASIPEDDIIVMNDAYLEKIPQCTSGRVYVLKITSCGDKKLFWMQEDDENKDKERVDAFNKLAGGLSTTPVIDVPPACVTPSTGSSAMAEDPLTQIWQSLRQHYQQQEAMQQVKAVPLSLILTSDSLAKLADDPEAMAELTTFAPPEQNSPHSMKEILRCPQLAAAISTLSQVIHSEQLQVFMASIGLQTPDATQAYTDPMGTFITALIEKYGLKEDTASSAENLLDHGKENANDHTQ